MSYNLISNDNFVFSTTVSTNIEGDGLEKGLSTSEYLFSFFQKEYFSFFFENINRLYGQGSRDCVFEQCFIYNPYFDTSGKVPDSFQQHFIFIRALNILLGLLFSIGSPIGLLDFSTINLFLIISRKIKLLW